MTDKQQIEEMAKDCYYVAHLLRFNDPYMLSLNGWSKLTEEMIKIGWVKPSKDSVLLTRREYKEIAEKGLGQLQLEQERKETAKEIFSRLLSIGSWGTQFDWNDYFEIDMDDFRKLAKQYGVEVDE